MATLSVQQLRSHLAQGVKPLYVLCGEEPLQQLEGADAIRQAIRSGGELERSSFTVSGANFDWGQVTASLSGLSLFAEQQLIEIHIPSAKPGREGGVVLQQLAQNAMQLSDVCILLSLPQSLDRATKNTAWFKALNECGVMVDCLPVEARLLPQWLTQRMTQVGLQLKSGDEGKRTVAFLAEHVEGNLLAAHQEIEKMALLYVSDAGQPYEVSYEEVQQAVSNVARYELFALPQAILSGQLTRSMKMLDGLISEGESAVRIHWVLANEVSALWRARKQLDAGKPLPMALREARVWGARERLFEQALPRLSSRACLRLLRMAQTCDGLVKGLHSPGWPDDAVAALRKLTLEIVEAVGASGGGTRNKANFVLRAG